MSQPTHTQSSNNGFHFPITVRLDDETLKLFNEFKENHKMLNGSAARYIMVEGLMKISAERNRNKNFGNLES